MQAITHNHNLDALKIEDINFAVGFCYKLLVLTAAET